MLHDHEVLEDGLFGREGASRYAQNGGGLRDTVAEGLNLDPIGVLVVRGLTGDRVYL